MTTTAARKRKRGRATSQGRGEPSAALYLRVSTEEQVLHGVSLDAQRERALAYCAMQNLIVAPEHIFVDDGVSAGKPLRSRPAGGALLDAIGCSKVVNVVAVKLDRLFRDAIDCLTVAREWEERGVAKPTPRQVASFQYTRGESWAFLVA